MSKNPPGYEPPKKSLYYCLKYRKPVPCEDFLRWGKWLGKTRTKVRKTFIGRYFISTVFLGMDHNFSTHGQPLLFETMVIKDGDWCGEAQYRCETWRQALRQHWDAVRGVKDEIPTL